MFDFLVMVLIIGGLMLFGWGIFEAFGRIAAHLRGNPEAAKAIVEHVFLPLFGSKSKTDRKLSSETVMVLRNSSSEPSSSD